MLIKSSTKIAGFVIIVFFLHKLLLNALYKNQIGSLSLEKTYLLFSFLTIFVIVAVYAVCKKNFDSAGFAFIGVTLLKIGFLFFVFNTLISKTDQAYAIEKANLILVFVFFSILETIICVKFFK